jgi:plasmid stabilization system protein ParE
VAFKIIYTEQSLADLERIIEFIRSDKPTAAARFGDALLNHIDLLSSYPYMGSPVSRPSGIRKILHSPVQVYYRILRERAVVEILHLWHAARELGTPEQHH